jgi:hypothetical protein
MCPICISAAALATLAGSGSAGGLAAFVAVKLHLKKQEDEEGASRRGMDEAAPEIRTAGDRK